MKKVICYYSAHHGNTHKLLEAIKKSDPDVKLIDTTKRHEYDLHSFDKVGFASGIYYGKFAEQVLNFARINLPPSKDVFFIATAGNPGNNCFNSISQITEGKLCNEVGRYVCKGFDTFGPFKLVGGIQKGHPTDEEIQAAVDFYTNL